jgi:hypothetical protein
MIQAKNTLKSPHLTIDEYILTAGRKGLRYRSEYSNAIVDPLNADRLLTTGDLGSYLQNETIELLEQCKAGFSGAEVLKDRIISPLLRTIDDFTQNETVWARPLFKAEWRALGVLAIDDTLGGVLVSPTPKIKIILNPKFPSLFSEQDYRKLQKPENSRRPTAQSMAARFALGLSMFGIDSNDELEDVQRTHRHFDLVFDPYTFSEE